MSEKRPLPPVYRQKKKICRPPQDKLKKPTTNTVSDGGEGGTGSAFQLLRSLFPKDKFATKFPPVVMKHQLYSLVPSRTDAERSLTAMQDRGEVRLFKLGPRETDVAVVSTDDFFTYVRRRNPGNATVENFLTRVVADHTCSSYTRQFLMEEQGFREGEISELVRHGLLALRDVGRWWLGLPDAGAFVKALLRGRKATLQMLRRSKYRELLRRELESRKLPRSARLGIAYHVHDVVGADLVARVRTTSGDLLRLRD